MTTSTAHSEAPDPNPPAPIGRLLQLVAPDRADVFIVIGFAIVVGILSLAVPIAVQALVNFVAFGGLVQPLIVLGVLLFAFLGLAGVVRTLKACAVELIQRRLFVRVSVDLARRLPRVRMEAFDRQHGPELVNRFFDVLTVQKSGSTLLLDGVGMALQSIIALVILAFYHPFLLAFDVGLILAIVFIIVVLGRSGVRTAIYESKMKYAVAASLEEIARNPLTFKSGGGNGYAARHTDAAAVKYIEARRDHFRVVLRQIIGAVTLHAVAGTALLVVGGWLVIQGQLTLGQLVAAELIVATMLATFAKFGKQLESFYDLLAGVDKLGQLLDLPLESERGARIHLGTGPAALELTEVTYAYPEGAQPLTGFNLRVEAGERVGIVATQGSGKSTLSELMFGVRHPTSGRLSLANVDYREIQPTSLREAIALIKGAEIIEGSLYDNVRLDREGVDDDAVRGALRRVGLLEKALSLPDGLFTPLSAKGRPLSDGDARLVVLARAIAGHPRVIVADHLFDDLDDRARAHAVEALFEEDRRWTIIAFAHDASHLSGFDRVITLDSGSRGWRPGKSRVTR